MFDGVHDTVTFEGIIDTIESSDASLFSGVGTATGSRPGYTACNPGFDYVPSGSGPAEFYGVVVDDTITISAFAGLYNVLSGVTTAPFEVDIAGGTATYGNPPCRVPQRPARRRRRPGRLPPRLAPRTEMCAPGTHSARLR